MKNLSKLKHGLITYCIGAFSVVGGYIIYNVLLRGLFPNTSSFVFFLGVLGCQLFLGVPLSLLHNVIKREERDK